MEQCHILERDVSSKVSLSGIDLMFIVTNQEVREGGAFWFGHCHCSRQACW